MKKSMTMGAIAIALLTAVGCSETETDLVIDSGNDDQVALGITPNLKVDASSKAATKSVVSGEVITYDAANYSNADYAPGLGILITNSAANGWYTPDGAEYSGHHVWYMGNDKGAGWISIKDKKTTFAETKEVPYYLTKEVGQVYAYYPYDATINISTISSASDLKIPVTVLTTGEIDATKNNAKKYWNKASWGTAAKGDLVNLSLSTEKDYLYFAGTAGRYVNNGRTAGETPVTPDAEPNNSNSTNPGYKINLDMKHAMSMVSFRVYDGGNLSTSDVNLTKFEIKNNANSDTDPFKVGSGTMSLVDGTIAGPSTTTGMARTITNYILMRQVDPTTGTEGDHAFKSAGTSTTSVNGKTVSKTVSAIVYPTTFSEGDIDVVITLKEGTNPEMVFPVTLPANEWAANNNYIYTLSAGRNKLTVMDVTVEAWVDNEQDEIPL